MYLLNSHNFVKIVFLLLVIVFVYATVAEPNGEVDLRAYKCYREVLSAIPNNYIPGCGGSYPAACGDMMDLLSCDDGKWEKQPVELSTYSGIKIVTQNSDVTNCSRIDSVFLCYEWWLYDHHEFSFDCIIAVDADWDGTFSTVTTECPGDTANPGVTCVNITSLESWECNNFFGSMAGSYVRTELSNTKKTTLFTDVLFFNVSYSSDSAIFVDTTVNSDSLPFGSVDPGTSDNPAAYTIKLMNTDHSTVPIDVYLKNTKMFKEDDETTYMGCAELSVNTINDPGGSTNFDCGNYLNGWAADSGYVEDIAILNGAVFYFWHDVPVGQVPGTYRSTVTIHSVADGYDP